MIDETKWEIASETADEIVLRRKRDEWADTRFVVTASGYAVPDRYLAIQASNFFNAWPSIELAAKAAAMMRVTNALIWAKLRVEPEFDPDWGDEIQKKYYPDSRSTSYWYLDDHGIPAYSSEGKALEAQQLLIDAGIWGQVMSKPTILERLETRFFMGDDPIPDTMRYIEELEARVAELTAELERVKWCCDNGEDYE
jgi:hypothetical protein